MKKFIISVFLAFSVFVSSVSVSFAVTPEVVGIAISAGSLAYDA